MSEIHSLQEMFRDYNCEDFKPISYSGRGMHGKTCLAFRISDIGKFISKIIALLEIDFYNNIYNKTDIAEAFQNMKMDNLGLDMVVYFPNIPFIDDEEYDEEEEE